MFQIAPRCLLEVEHPDRRLSRLPPAHFLVGHVEEALSLEPLEAGRRPSRPPVPMLVADDHQLLRRAMQRVAEQHPTEMFSVEGHAGRMWRLDGASWSNRFQTILEHVLVRPLCALPAEGRFLTALAPLSDPGLLLRPIHRALHSLETFHEDRFLTLVQEYARVYELDGPLTDPERLETARDRLAALATGHHAVLLLLPGGRGKILRFRQALELSQVKAVPRNPTLRSLDLALLNALVLRTVLGVAEPDVVPHPHVDTVHSLSELVTGVEQGRWQAGFALNPPPAWEIRAVMEAAQVLPRETLAMAPSFPHSLFPEAL